MTIRDMHYTFRVKLDRLDNNFYANITPTEVDLFLNEAQDIFIKQRFTGHNVYKTSFEETEKRIEDLKEITVPDTALSVSAVQTGVKPNGVFYTLPSDFMFSIQEDAEITYDDCNGNSVTARKGYVSITHAEYLYMRDNPFAIPTSTENFGVRLMSNNKVEVLTFGNYTINYYYLRYIRVPDVLQYSDNTNIPSGTLVAGKRYKVSLGSIVHNGSTLTIGDIFIAQNAVFTGTGSVVLDGVDCELNSNIHNEIVNIAVDRALEVIESPRTQTHMSKLINQE